MAPGRIQRDGQVPPGVICASLSWLCSHSEHLLCSDPFDLSLKREAWGMRQEDTEMYPGLLCVCPSGVFWILFFLIEEIRNI